MIWNPRLYGHYPQFYVKKNKIRNVYIT